jgi:phage-related protein
MKYESDHMLMLLFNHGTTFLLVMITPNEIKNNFNVRSIWLGGGYRLERCQKLNIRLKKYTN